MDGRTNNQKLLVVDVDGAALTIIPVEDLIADRVAQAYSVDPPRPDMLDQAVKLLQLSGPVDLSYLDRRIVEESDGAANLEALKRQ
jgi:hypothetical protein